MGRSKSVIKKGEVMNFVQMLTLFSNPTIQGRVTEELQKSTWRIFWAFLAVILFVAVAGVTVVGILGFMDKKPKPLAEVVHLTFKNHQGFLTNQSAIMDPLSKTVTYTVTSLRNQTSVVLFDSKNSLVCYKPAEEKACFLRKMESRDVENIKTSVNISAPKNEQPLLQHNQTKYYREFLGILGGRKVSLELVGGPVQTLCENLPIYWVKRSDGPGKQRLIYLCIDICFPSNICVSVCFYYLPD
ncbi:BRICHOS domain-containing protein 5 [Ambystoma mexicanum]|uniref:BRICHOS domain-containing protein 5 n=1 Tax=Ambystoma mexicanum TaxID=8296 RepID=UPI0037E7C000